MEPPTSFPLEICLLGVSGAGKTTTLYEAMGDYAKNAEIRPTICVEPHRIEVSGRECLVWDVSGNKYALGLGFVPIASARVGILFVDGEKTLSSQERDIVRMLKMTKKGIPILVVHSKCEGKGCEEMRKVFGKGLLCGKRANEIFERAVEVVE
jgi:signal recognition particle receptor subunit beta